MQDQTKEVTLGETNLEHIYPQNPEANEWGGEAGQAALDPYVWHVGNLTIFGKSRNRKAGNKEFPSKKPLYDSSNVVMTLDVGKNFQDWNVHAPAP